MIIVTGASGFLGQHVMWRLTQPAVRDDRLRHAGPGDVVVHLAAVCGGIGFNKQRNVDMMAENLRIGLDAFDRHRNARRHVYVSTTCMYPQICRTPFVEADIWQGRPEYTNAPYGIAKRAISDLFLVLDPLRNAVLVPANLYGPGDHYEPERSHVIPALIAKMVAAKDDGVPALKLDGSGGATRDFLYVEDCADAVASVLSRPDDCGYFNVGTGVETTIHELAHMIAEIIGYRGELYWSGPERDGQPRRVLNAHRARCHWRWEPKVDLRTGLERTVEDYLCRRH